MRSGLFEFNRGLVYIQVFERMKFSFNKFLFEMHSPKKRIKKGEIVFNWSNCYRKS